MLSTSGPLEQAGIGFPAPGLGVPCREAQADGTPCTQLRSDCADCDKAVQAEAFADTKIPAPASTHA